MWSHHAQVFKVSIMEQSESDPSLRPNMRCNRHQREVCIAEWTQHIGSCQRAYFITVFPRTYIEENMFLDGARKFELIMRMTSMLGQSVAPKKTYHENEALSKMIALSKYEELREEC